LHNKFILDKHKSLLAGSSAERDSVKIQYFHKNLIMQNLNKILQLKILIVCFACLAMAAIFRLVMQPTTAYFNHFPSYIVQRFSVWVYNFAYWLGLCTEEISLCLLVRDFRKHLKQQLRAIFPCFGKLNIVGYTFSTTGVQQQQR
jgi:hypothetical protein